jgi:hypothetical protein
MEWQRRWGGVEHGAAPIGVRIAGRWRHAGGTTRLLQRIALRRTEAGAMGFFGKPDIEKMRRDRDVAGLVHWADFRRDKSVSRAAVAGLRENVYEVVEHLYETAASAHARRGPGRRGPSPRGVYLLNETVTALVKVGAPAVTPLADSVRVYDDYGDPDESVRFLYLALVFDVLEKIGRPAAVEVRSLAQNADGDIRKLARQVLEKMGRRGQLDEEGDPD